ncbi:MAG: SbcC/MukB-like Walker B domain-containing protein, partial [Pseudomonadales bacterium]
TKILELAWHQGQAAILAQDLNVGQPCPVCGSSEHPQPAQSEQPLPTQVQLDQARDNQQLALDRLTAARENYAGLKSHLDALQKQCGQASVKLAEVANLPVDQLQQQHDTLLQDVTTLLKQQKQLTQLEERIVELKASEEQARTTLDAATKQASELATQLATARSRVSAAEQELPEQYRQAGALQAAIAQVQNKIAKDEEQLKRAREAYDQASAAWQAAKATELAAEEAQEKSATLLQQANDAWSAVLQSSCFESQQDYSNAGLSETDFKTLQQDIAEYDAECQRVSGSIEQQQKTLEGQQKPDIVKFEAAQEVAEQEKREAEDCWLVLDKRLTALQNTQKKLAEAQKSCKALEDEYKVIGTLSDVANGQTGDKVSLQRFVLSVLLDDVLLEASQRLSIMSKGRYQLLRKEDRSKGNKASGLDLEVEDAYTGKVRPVATLSGGESFMAALAMALGLSDVVQAYAGGIRLDTLFIDEGFGSLDPESLDLAVRTLIDLQASGRMVGVISHVPDLKEQMSQRLDVIAGREGSKVRLVVG